MAGAYPEEPLPLCGADGPPDAMPSSATFDGGPVLGPGGYAGGIGDLDGDGYLDVAVASSPFRIYRNLGNGEFGVGLEVPQTIDGNPDVWLGDFDGNGWLDVILSVGFTHEVWLNAGGGNLAPASTFEGGGFIQAVGDLDGDEDVDVWLSPFDGQPSTLALNDGNGEFELSPAPLETSYPLAVALGDLDDDDDLDAFVPQGYLPGRVWFNDGDGNFSKGSQELGGMANGLALGDVDGDDDLDAYQGNYAEQVADNVLLNDGSGVFSDTQQTLDELDTWSVELADLDGDGDLDALTGNDPAGGRVWLNDGDGHFSSSGQALGDLYTIAVRTGDLDCDGDQDALLVQFLGSARIWWNE